MTWTHQSSDQIHHQIINHDTHLLPLETFWKIGIVLDALGDAAIVFPQIFAKKTSRFRIGGRIGIRIRQQPIVWLMMTKNRNCDIHQWESNKIQHNYNCDKILFWVLIRIRLDGCQNSGNVVDWAPLVLKNVQANLAICVNIWVKHSHQKLDLLHTSMKWLNEQESI